MKIRQSSGSRQPGGTGGFTIIEAAIAGCILAVFLTGLYDANWRALSLLKTGVQSVAAARALQNRIEQIRTSTWSQITTPSSYISGTILSGTTLSTTQASGDLGNLTETITISQYPLPSGYVQGGALPSSSIQVVQNPNGSVTTVQIGDGSISTDNMIRADVTESWSTTLTNQNNTRMMSTIITQGGISGRNH